MEEENFEFTLEQISIYQSDFPQPVKDFTAAVDGLVWRTEFTYAIGPHSENKDKKLLSVNLAYYLTDKDYPQKKVIAALKISSRFKITSRVSEHKKPQLLTRILFPIADDNLQGIYAVKTEGSALALILPPGIDFTQYETDDSFLEEIKNEWN